MNFSSDVTKLTKEDAINVLGNAAAEGRADIVEKILDRGDVHPDTMNSIGMYPIVYAASHNCVSVIKLLVQRGSSVNVIDKSRRNALKSAAANRAHESLKVLVELGADPNIETSDGEVALTLLCDNYADSCFDSICLLLPITAAKYHQLAYNACRSEEARSEIARHGFVQELGPPEGGFGGKRDKDNDKINTPPVDPLLAQLYHYLEIMLDVYRIIDPNVAFELALYKCSLGGDISKLNNPDEMHLDDSLIYRIVGHFAMLLSGSIDIDDFELPDDVPEKLSRFDLLYKEVLRRYRKIEADECAADATAAANV